MKNSMRPVLIAVCVLISCAGCSADHHVREPTRTASPGARPTDRASAVAAPSALTAYDDGRRCAARAPHTKIGAQIIDSGAALVFTTSDDVSVLRRRAGDLTLPPSLASAGPRVDNIQHGVRLVFEAGPTGDVTLLRREVIEHAHRIAKRCGLVLAAPSDKTAARSNELAEQRRVERSPPAEHRPTQETRASKERPVEAKTDKATSGKPAKPAPKPDTKTKPAPKPSEKPTAPDKPNEGRKPKEDKQPRLPRLPGPHPDPILPCAVACAAPNVSRAL